MHKQLNIHKQLKFRRSVFLELTLAGFIQIKFIHLIVGISGHMKYHRYVCILENFMTLRDLSVIWSAR